VGRNLADRRRDVGLLLGFRPGDLALRKALADLGETLLDTLDVLDSGCRGRRGQRRWFDCRAAVEARARAVYSFLQRLQRGIDGSGRWRLWRFDGRLRRRPHRGLCRFGEEGIQAGANVVERQRARRLRRRLDNGLLHGGDAPIEFAEGVTYPCGVRRPWCRYCRASAQPLDRRARLFVGIVDLAREIPDHGRDLLEKPGPFAGPARSAAETGDGLFDGVEAARQQGNSGRARPRSWRRFAP